MPATPGRTTAYLRAGLGSGLRTVGLSAPRADMRGGARPAGDGSMPDAAAGRGDLRPTPVVRTPRHRDMSNAEKNQRRARPHPLRTVDRSQAPIADAGVFQ